MAGPAMVYQCTSTHMSSSKRVKPAWGMWWAAVRGGTFESKQYSVKAQSAESKDGKNVKLATFAKTTLVGAGG